MIVLSLVGALALACSTEEGSGGTGGSAGGGGAGAGGGGGVAGGGGSAGSTGGTSAAGGAAGAGATGGAAGSAGGGGASGGSGGGSAVVGNPALYSESVLELDFSQGTNGKYRANGGAWQDFGAWTGVGNNGNWKNAGVNVQTTNAIRTALVPNGHGPGSVLRTWIEAGDQWKSGAAYPRTELTSSYTGGVAFGSEWRMELPFSVTGDVANAGDSIIGFQFHHNGNTGSPPFSLSLNDGSLRFKLRQVPSGGTTEYLPLFPLQADTVVSLVFEVKFGYAADGAYVRLWANGKQYVNITGKNVGYPDLETTAGYWKFCSLYDWSNAVKGTRSVFSGPLFKLLKRP
jgi:hypothetical protein